MLQSLIKLTTDTRPAHFTYSNRYATGLIHTGILNIGPFQKLKISPLYKIFIFQCMGKIFCVEFQRVPLKFHTKYLVHTLKDEYFIQIWRMKSS